jgi:hypothetical protein
MTGNRQFVQHAAVQERHDLRLIPPLSEDFSVYGGPDTIERAREWALKYRLCLRMAFLPAPTACT